MVMLGAFWGEEEVVVDTENHLCYGDLNIIHVLTHPSIYSPNFNWPSSV